MIAPEKSTVVACGIYGRFIAMDYVWFVTNQSALRTASQTIKDLERENKALTGDHAA